MKEIFVYADWQGLNGPKPMGILKSQLLRGKEIFSFEYDSEWLKNSGLQELDPDLKLFAGPQYIDGDKYNFGIFLDSSPDRWGRTLMKRREAIIAREESRKAKPLFESHFLLGLKDETRMGAIRFKLYPDGPFLDEGLHLPSPPMTSIRELEQASLRYEADNFIDDPKAKEWLGLLMAPGSSLGGARPKANVIDPDENLWIAKFPSKNDQRDSGAWEYLTYLLAIQCGIRMAPSQAGLYSQKQHTFLTRRFDRIQNQRLHFASAMTLLGYKDGHDHKEGGSYLDLVELIDSYGAEPNEDIRELWQRIVYSVAISNTDDHLRNHGFLLLPNKGWKLSPAYDLNPNPDGHGLNLNINEDDNSLSFELCLSVAEHFRWTMSDAREEILKIKTIVSKWHETAKSLGLNRTEIELTRSAFEK